MLVEYGKEDGGPPLLERPSNSLALPSCRALWLRSLLSALLGSLPSRSAA